MQMRPRIAVAASIFLLIGLTGGALAPAEAQLSPPDAPEPAATPPSEPESEPESESKPVIVIDAFAYDPDIKAVDASGTPEQIAYADARAALDAARTDGVYATIELSGMVAVKVSAPNRLLGRSYEACSKVRLVFDQAVFQRNAPFRCTADLVVFNLAMLDRAEESAWQQLVKKRRGTAAYARISLLGPEGGKPLTSEATDRKIRLVNRPLAWVAGVGFLVVLVGFFRLARESNMIRDGGKKRAPDEPLRPYSLARVQTAWWFFLVLFGFLFITLIDGSLTDIPNSVLGLMGIAGGTFLGSELVDSSRRKNAKQTAGEELYPVASDENTGFFLDIFSDDSGVAFHRFQMAVWTVALGIIFTVRVLRNLDMPQFETSILGLMGISSGTYLGMKLPETPKGTTKPSTPPAAPGGGQ